MKRIFLALLSGALLGAPFLVPALWPLALVGVAPLLGAFARPLPSRHAFGIGLLAGLVYYGLAIWAIFWTALPLDWLGAFDHSFQIMLVVFFWGMTVLGFALWLGLFGFLYALMQRDSWSDIFIAAALWVVCEWAGAWWFGIQNAGTGAVFGPHATLAFIGNLLARDTALVQLAWFGGVYALSFLCIASAVAIYRSFYGSSRERRMLVLLFLAASVLWFAAHVFLARTPSSQNGTHITVAAISTQAEAAFEETSRSNAAHLEEMIKTLAHARNAALVVLPEGSDLLQLLNTPSPRGAAIALRDIYAGTRLPTLVDSGNTYSDTVTLRSRAVVYDAALDTYEYQDKHFILPYGEYAPTYMLAFVYATGQGDSFGRLVQERGLTAGNDIRPLAAASTSIGVLFCDEAMSPELYTSLASRDAAVFVNLASHAWFHGSHFVAEQMKNVAIVRAVESRRWYVQASNIAPSFILDPYGRVATSSAWGAASVVTADVEARHDMTPYVRFGAWVVWASFLTLLITGLRSYRRMR